MIADRDFLNVAVRLCLTGVEADWRTAASRAYFAAFHCARTLMTAMGFEVPRGDQAHGYLWRRLESCGAHRVGEAGSLLSELRTYRNRADYDLATDFTIRDAKYSVESAADLMRTLTSLTPEERSAAATTIQTYERDVLHEPTWRPRPR
jgi:uncharacterized protein (UPF0332 family)